MGIEAKFLWEPRGFYDSVRGGGYDDARALGAYRRARPRGQFGDSVWQVPAYANAKYRKTEMVTARELLERAQALMSSSQCHACATDVPPCVRALPKRMRDTLRTVPRPWRFSFLHIASLCSCVLCAAVCTSVFAG